MDNVRNAILIELVLYNNDNIMCVGPTGTGKTITVIGKLSRNMHKKFICDFMSFSARTSANQTQVGALIYIIFICIQIVPKLNAIPYDCKMLMIYQNIKI